MSQNSPINRDLLKDIEARSQIDGDVLMESVRRQGDESTNRMVLRFQGLVDAFLPESLQDEGLDVRRRARFVVTVGLLLVPFYALLVQQLLASELIPQALVAVVCGIISLICVAALRISKSHVWPGTIICGILSFVLFFQAFADAGLHDPILYWTGLVPLAAALSVGPRLSVVSVVLNLIGISVLFWLTKSGHEFPHLSAASQLDLAAFLAVSSASLFALLWGWFYEGHTLRELGILNRGIATIRAALERSEERYQALFNNVPQGVYRSTPSGRILVANHAMVSLLGYDSEEEVRGLLPEEQIYAYPELRMQFKEQIESEGEVRHFSSIWRQKDGRHIHVRENARVVYSRAGEPLFYEGTVEDVTAQRRVQEALRNSEERFRALVQHSSDIITVLDGAGGITYLSPSIKNLLGYEPEDLVGRDSLLLLHPDDRPRIKALLSRVGKESGARESLEFRMLHAEGHYVYIESIGANLLHDVNVRGIVLNSRDITERKRTEAILVAAKEQAEEVARLKSNFLANMSHEIRTPLTGILGFSSILAEEITDPEQREFVTFIEKSGRRLMETLNSVLDLARLESGHMSLTVESIPVADSVQEIIHLMNPLAQERNIRLDAEILVDDTLANVDVGALNRILTNLVGNAIKFTAQGFVRVQVDSDKEEILVHVSDTGSGIDEKFLPRIFSEFEQESTGIGRSYEGSGLGLTITHHLVERMGGTISVESERGVGSAFTVRLPRAFQQTAAPKQTFTSPDLPSPNIERVDRYVMVVDDNETTRFLMERMLENDFSVHSARSEEDALASASKTRFDAVLMDINLGTEASGEQVMHRIREIEGYESIPIIAFTAYALPGDRERFLHAGFDAYLSKPFTKAQLLSLFAEFGPLPVRSFEDPLGDDKMHLLIPGPGARAAERLRSGANAPDEIPTPPEAAA